MSAVRLHPADGAPADQDTVRPEATGRRARRRHAGAAVATLLAVLGGTGCTLQAREGEGPGAELLAALDEARYETPPPTGLTYVDAARANELRAEDEDRFAFVARLGTPLLNLRDFPAERYGLDPEHAEATVTVDFSAPYGYWDGTFEVAEITGNLAADGFTERETEAGQVWVHHGRGLGLMVEEHRVRWGDEQLDPARTEASGAPLADRDPYRDLAACLGEVYRADFVEAVEGSAVPFYAIGHRAAAVDDTSTVLCAVTADEDTAADAQERLRAEVTAGQARYAGAEVAALDGPGGSPGVAVTVPDRPEQRPGRLLDGDTDLTDALRAL
ncbi:hypothetical protein RM844_31460 [Streptomyces sp. DSM 44915]|uniref:Lipoprotein n=1 Tax=Streptomyces chisholmiae TaxID=3075540 RepID=A0ABU2K0K9_9ACTN|nr:hypothetical protein [Streptomyces sp. DSM 44915]MDT0270796.1 hypothetical protein [Streptomyces sp. DSM 44915]